MSIRYCFLCIIILVICTIWLQPDNVPTLIAEPTARIQLQFPYNVNSRYVDILTTGAAASVTPSPTGATGVNCATISSGTGTTGAAAMLSRARLRNQVGVGQVGVFSALFDNVSGPLATGSATGVVDNSRLIGLGNLVTGPANPTGTAPVSVAGVSPGLANVQDGFFFGYLNDSSAPGAPDGSIFGIIHRQGGSSVGWYPYTDWNGDPLDGTGESGVSLEPGNGNIYKIQYQGIGFGVVKFYVENPDNGCWILVHTIEYPNSFTGTNLFNATLRLYAASINDGTTTNTALETCSMAGVIEGRVNTSIDMRNSAANTTGVTTLTTGTYNNILTILNNTTFNTTTNQVTVKVDRLSIAQPQNNNPTEFTLFLNPTVGGTPVFTDVGPTTSVVSFDIAGTTVTGGINLGSFYIVNNQRYRRDVSYFFGIFASGATVFTQDPTEDIDSEEFTFDLSCYNIELMPGDKLVVAARLVAELLPDPGAPGPGPGGGPATVGGTGYASLSWLERF